jgi:hypothetical protein
VPENLFAIVSLRQLADMAGPVLKDTALGHDCRAFAHEIEAALAVHARVHDPKRGETWAYEVDGYGNQLFMDDANVPSLLGLPYLGCCTADDPMYVRTRARVLSYDNPYFFRGSSAEGIGGPHVGLDMIWPMAILMRALTSTGENEIRQCLRWIKATHAGTGFIHEAFHKDDPGKFTRSWFAWANSLFGELIVKLSHERPALLKTSA